MSQLLTELKAQEHPSLMVLKGQVRLERAGVGTRKPWRDGCYGQGWGQCSAVWQKWCVSVIAALSPGISQF